VPRAGAADKGSACAKTLASTAAGEAAFNADAAASVAPPIEAKPMDMHRTPRTPRRGPGAFASLPAALLAAALLAGCGGGIELGYYDDDFDHGGGHGSALDRAAGFYEGTDAAQRKVSVMVIETGRYYVLYGPAGSPQSSLIEGVILGDGTAGGSTFTSLSFADLNFTNQTAAGGALAATFSLQRYFDANIGYAGGATDSFAADYSFDYEQRPALATIAGSYAGQLAALSGVGDASLSIDVAGGLSLGTTAGGCGASGSIVPHPFGNVYDVTLSFGPGCPAAGRSLSGHARFDAASRSLVAVTTASDLSSTALVVATRTP
jgi:hypothetical protein